MKVVEIKKKNVKSDAITFPPVKLALADTDTNFSGENRDEIRERLGHLGSMERNLKMSLHFLARCPRNERLTKFDLWVVEDAIIGALLDLRDLMFIRHEIPSDLRDL